MKKKIIISAFNIHTGGGFVLLKSILKYARIKEAILDKRIINKIKLSEKYTLCRRKILDRLFLFHKSCFNSKRGEIILCFNGLPPLFKTKAKVILFVQTFYFFSSIKNYNFNLYTFLRITFEKIWFNLGVKNADEIWVQTALMKEKLLKYLLKKKIKKKISIKITPLVDDDIKQYNQKKIKSIKNNQYFIYPADDAGHKNHIRLLKSFDKINLDYKLYLTLKKNKFEEFIKKAKISNSTIKKIENLNFMPRKKMLDFFKKKISSIIFPSLDESFGLPLIESYFLKKFIIASNLAYVKSIVKTPYLFDPYNVNSITKAIKFFLLSKKKNLATIQIHKFLRSKKFISLAK